MLTEKLDRTSTNLVFMIVPMVSAYGYTVVLSRGIGIDQLMFFPNSFKLLTP
ncbi:MAG: hypothetical protein NC203_07565 [Firmicutes bacterium]|nr:hypothetical protein [Bacillota bacterium]